MLDFEKACWIARQASQCQQAFSKPCLVDLISKETHLEFSIYSLTDASDKFYLDSVGLLLNVIVDVVKILMMWK